jgi:predicted DNA-binding transcriptional regulator AlpA
MDRIFIPTEKDFRQWIKDALEECLQEGHLAKEHSPLSSSDDLLNRKEVAALFRISLVTLHDWMNRGFPCHKQRGRVYFMRSEVMEYAKQNRRLSRMSK